MPEETPSRLGRYELKETIGQGAMGVVYRAYDSFLDRTVAVKTYRQDVAFLQQVRERFEREVRTASRLSHPNVVVVYDGGLEEGIPYLAMELVEGPTLRDVLTKRGPLPREEALGLFFAIAEGLAYAHSRGVVHRDLKPANILIAPGGIPKISDFGVARLLDVASSAKTQTMGTPGYMAPEQIQGKEVGQATDIFALAILGYELVTGKRPFDAPTAITLFFQILKTEPTPPSEVATGLSKAVDRVFAHALAKNPASRTPDVAAFVTELREALAALPDPPEVVPPKSPAPAADVRSWIAGALAVLIVGGAAAYRFGGCSEGDEPAVVALAEATPTAVVPPTAKPTQEEPPTPAPEPTDVPVAEVPVVEEVETPEAVETPTREVVVTPPPQAVEPSPMPTAKPRMTAAATRPTRRPTEASAGGAAIDVASDPPKAEVLIDGVVKGRTPLHIPGLTAGNVLLELRKKGYAPYYKSLHVERGSDYTVRAKLSVDQRTTGWLSVTSQPPGAKVLVDGAPSGIAPIRLGPLPPGRYRVEADFPGYSRASQAIELRAGESHKITFTFGSPR